MKYASILERNLKTERGAEGKRFPLLTRRYRDYLEWCSSHLGVDEGSSVVMTFRDYCARVLQVWWRTALRGGRETLKIVSLGGPVN